MDTVERFHKEMPAMLDHEGVWAGTYTHIDREAKIIDQHKAHIHCEFPKTGPYVYVQHNHFTWTDGTERRAVLPSTFQDGRLWWDLETFKGSAWQTHDGLIMLNLDRKDEPGANFFEIIAMGATGKHRSRTWHWFRDGQLYKRTLCDEWKLSD